jgi:hypothetical protein
MLVTAKFGARSRVFGTSPVMAVRFNANAP